MNRNDSAASKTFDVFNHIFLCVYGVACILPFLYIVGASFADSSEIISRSLFLVPRKPTVAAYEYIFSSPTLPRAMMNSIVVTLLGTVTSMFFTLTMAYPLSKKNLYGRSLILNLVAFTMVFSGGLIPTFLVVNGLHLIDTFAALILPCAINTFNLIVIKNFFQALPLELEEAARIDGCHDLMIFARIVLPLSMPVIATFTLMYAVGYWNDYFNSLIYLNDMKKWPLQLILRQIVMLSQGKVDNADLELTPPPAQSVKMAVVVFATVPILCVYPFLQKHFAKGVLLGSVKG
ncbi:MAG: carbohydrate ABC transporter permease [Clostridiales bacterium]|jgi:putative aldouronate transport system permease protein|nr:carbohydrate ABC transporter permease [Clostridiales bacterium]MDR2752625.1 carbohydrate ABC transporter permease [Clostridiales bacterium]